MIALDTGSGQASGSGEAKEMMRKSYQDYNKSLILWPTTCLSLTLSVRSVVGAGEPLSIKWRLSKLVVLVCKGLTVLRILGA